MECVRPHPMHNAREAGVGSVGTTDDVRRARDARSGSDGFGGERLFHLAGA